MEAITDVVPLLVIVGPTASGKSAWAMELARTFDGEIIAGDARTIYRGMDIGTAKPSADDRQKVPHHLVDMFDPDQVVTAAQFKQLTLGAIADIARRGKLPILVGGSGMYVDGVLYDYEFNEPAKASERERLQQLTIAELQQQIQERGIAMPQNDRNPRHLIRALETGGRQAGRHNLRPNTLVISTSALQAELRERISRRVDDMVAQGLLEGEVRKLAERYGWDNQLGQTIGYKEFMNYLDGRETLPEVRQAIIRHTMAYAKRQKTWFKRNQAIIYPSNYAQAVEAVTTWLNKMP